MGLLDDLFGKEAINKLNKQLAEKVEEVARAESKVAELKAAVIDRDAVIDSLKSAQVEKQLENSRQISQLNALRAAALDKNVQAEDRIATLQASIAEAKAEALSAATARESIRVAALDKNVQAENRIATLQASIAEAKAEALSAATARESIERDWHQARECFDVKDRRNQEREAKLAEKSEKLLSERQKFQQQAADLHSREQRWKHSIEPQLRKHEAHLSLDSRELQLQGIQSQIEELRSSLESREADLIRRGCTDEALITREAEVADWDKLLTNLKADLEAKADQLNRQKSEQEARTYKLEDWALELFSFQGRVNKLDAECEKLEKEKNEIQSSAENNRATHLERLADLRRQRSALKGLENDIEQRESYLNTREKDVKREESRIALIKDKNLELRKEQKRLAALTETLDASNRASLSEIKRLTKKHEVFKASYGVIQERLKSAGGIGKINSSFTNAKVLSWLLEDGDPDATEIENGWLGATGNGPWQDQVLEADLEELGYQFFPLPDDDLEYVIVGRKGWSKTDLLAQIEAREGHSLRIYSQEMFFAKLVTGKDPFDAGDDELLDAFSADHPALQFLISLPEPWPTVTSDEPEDIVEIDGEDFGVSESPLHILGYRVGATSDLSVTKRRNILTECFESRELTFSEDSDDAYIAKWGRGGGAQRLYRMAAHIKSLADGRVGKDPRKPQARLDWVNDLKWLKEKYFANYKTRFSWPGV